MNKMRVIVFICNLLLHRVSAQIIAEDENGYTFINKVRFPYSAYYDPFVGLIMAFALELTDSPYDGEFAWSFEFNYYLPQNESKYTFPPIAGESTAERGFLDRTTLYEMVERKIDVFSENFGGELCFLRMICEMTCNSTKDTDVLGDIMHILLSPSSSVNKNLPKKYYNAELYGKKHGYCTKYIKKCPINLLAIFTRFGKYLENKLTN
ncbi:uncharacterized protein LOC132695599 [Cylas formicarius]|uniref:uncharacterized protein LOC132695599 n=1 Tax=Cylas formicarius TaxID=197179 RepID=UPI002958B46E|nr:uncharacterized protein LOC132695599 [Cylas formicarius]